MRQGCGLRWLAIACLAWGCGSSPEMDGGAATDAGTDAGFDAGPDGPVDAGVDAGPATPHEMVMESAAEVMGGVTDLTTAVDAVPMEMRIDGAFLDLDIGGTGIAAIVGEDGLMTLSLSPETARAYADLHTGRVLLELLDRAILALEGRSDPAVMAVRTQAQNLRASLLGYVEAVALLYRERLDLGIAGTPIVVDPYYGVQAFLRTGRPTRLTFPIEAASASPAEVMVEVICGTDTVDVQIANEETGVVVSSASGPGTVSFTVGAPFDETAIYAMIVSTPAPVEGYEECLASLTGRRRLRVAALPMTFGPMYLAALTDYRTHYANLSFEVQMLRGGGSDPSVLDAAEALAQQIADLAAPLIASDAGDHAVEDIERIEREMVYVGLMVDAASTSSHLSGFATLITELGNLRADVLALLATIRAGT